MFAVLPQSKPRFTCQLFLNLHQFQHCGSLAGPGSEVGDHKRCQPRFALLPALSKEKSGNVVPETCSTFSMERRDKQLDVGAPNLIC